MVPGFLSSCLSLKGGEGPEQILLTDTHGRASAGVTVPNFSNQISTVGCNFTSAMV